MQPAISYLTPKGWKRDLEDTLDDVNSLFDSEKQHMRAIYAAALSATASSALGMSLDDPRFYVGSGVCLGVTAVLFYSGLHREVDYNDPTI